MVHAALVQSPEKINTDPYGQGWLVVIELDDAGELDELMEAAAYGDLVAETLSQDRFVIADECASH